MMEIALPFEPSPTEEPQDPRWLEGEGPADLRQFLKMVEELGELKRIQAEVDLDQEMSAIVYLASRGPRSPTLLFENLKGYSASILWNMMSTSTRQIAVAAGLSPDLSLRDLIQAYRQRLKRRIPPQVLEPEEAPVYQNTRMGEEVDILEFPAPKHWPRDGGRYIGTADVVITRDPERGHLNVGTYRMMVHDRNHLGLYLSPGKDAKLHIEGWWRRGQPCEVVAALGIEPALYLVGGITMSKTESELDYAGGLKGRPIRLVPGKATSLPLPADAEVVLEGVIHPYDFRKEGPFGEFTGYYGRPEDLAPVVEIKAIHFRNQPVLTAALMADHWAANASALPMSILRSARIWDDLDRLGIPGIKGVYAFPAAAGSWGVTAISLEQRYAGHAPQVLALAAQCPGGAYFGKWYIAVDEDVDPTDINQVLWALSTRCNPVDDIDILRNTWSTWLDPTQNPPEERPYASKALINACKEHRYLEAFSPRTRLKEDVYRRVVERWKELDLPGSPPQILSFE